MKSARHVMGTDEIGQQFVEYFARLGYEPIPGSSLLDESLPMSFVMSAGMVQFEALSHEKRTENHYVLVQNCFRYFDLNRIGASYVHLSLFRMPAAFNFGAVNRDRSIHEIWNLLTEAYGLNPENLVVTYFGGDTIDDQTLPADEATASAWRAVGIPEKQIVALPAKHNFWVQSSQAVGLKNSRKRGPTTEVFFDRGSIYSCGKNCGPGCSCGRFVEFLNTLFITCRVDEKTGRLTRLEEPFTEIVIGLERVAMLLQGKDSVYEIDSIDPLVKQLLCYAKPLPFEVPGFDAGKFERILVDHLRALLFLIADGAPPPGRGGRSRLMRILVREFLTSQQLLGISDPGFLRAMAMAAIKLYPHLETACHPFIKYVAEENEIFDRTVKIALKELESILQRNNQRINGQEIFALEKKRGLPLPLLRYRLWQKNVDFDDEEYRLVREKFQQARQEKKKVKREPRAILTRARTDALIRTFLQYYRELEFQIIGGGSLIDDSIPMSFVMSAGLIQVERGMAFVSQQSRNNFALVQNCFRHFDLDKVGESNNHLSFFRMLGAFTFGELNNRTHIHTAWQLVCKNYEVPPEKIWVTYFCGGEINGHMFSPDLETLKAWEDVGIHRERILGLDQTTNFWKQSAMVVGAEHAPKCGPTSEMFFDRGEELRCGAACKPGCSCGRFIEFLNMLFIKWGVDDSTDQVYELENPFTETVVGVERLAMILQSVPSVFETDRILPIMEKIRKDSKFSKLEAQERMLRERILADHLRALYFLVADGAPAPGKGGRAFIIRRLVREILECMELLAITKEGFLPQVLTRIAKLHAENPGEKSALTAEILAFIHDERLKFEQTLLAGFRKIESILRNQNADWMSGSDILMFEKDYGLPLSLLTRFLQKRRIAFSLESYEEAKENWNQKQQNHTFEML